MSAYLFSFLLFPVGLRPNDKALAMQLPYRRPRFHRAFPRELVPFGLDQGLSGRCEDAYFYFFRPI